MKLRYKILLGILLLLVAGLGSLGLALSHDSACTAAPVPPAGATLMKAIGYRCYGSPDVLRLTDTVRPTVADDAILVKVHAAALNPLDWHFLQGTPYVFRLSVGIGAPKDPRLGVDFAGTVDAVGRNVTRVKPGDEVFGASTGAFAEYVSVVADDALARKPGNLTFEQAAAVPIAGTTALQALRDKGHIAPGQKVLINGASGGVGTFAVQIAKAFGAEVTGVCSTRNLQLVQSLGADHVIDYTKEDFTRDGQRYDLILDNVGNLSLAQLWALRRVLTPDGTVVIVGGGSASADPWIGPLSSPIKAMLLSKFVSQKFLMLFADMKNADLATLGDLMQAGKVTPVIDRRYPLEELPEAMRYLELGHARGKVVIDTEPNH